MNQSPIPKALSMLFKARIKALLMGGQACILYGAAEFSRDIDLAILVSPENLDNLQSALAELEAEAVFFPQLTEEALHRGHACHFRCRAREVDGLRIDVMGKMRGVDAFPELWERRVEIDLPEVGRIAVLALEDLVQAKKTQRDKDWPMIRRLVEADFHRHRASASTEQVQFWLAECRTPEILQIIARKYADLTSEICQRRPLLAAVQEGDLDRVVLMLREEEERERELDRQHWEPLKKELEQWRRRKI